MQEYEVKAAYLLRFTRYVEWPAGSFSTPEVPFIIGVLGRNPFDANEVRELQNATSLGRAVEVRMLADVKEARDCHLVFIGQGQTLEETAWLHELRLLPIVTVTDTLAGLERGAVLALHIETRVQGSRVVFSANLPAAERAGLRLSALMLASAKKVLREPKAKKEKP